VDINELDLIIQIDNLRSELLLVANNKGLRHPETIFASTKLDIVILNYQRLKETHENSTK
jgi:Spo0E like sporulation regulatory protein